MGNISIDNINKICHEMRKDCLLMADASGNSGFHFGGTLSMIEIISTLLFYQMNYNKDNLLDDSRDELIISKGHGVPALYAGLKELGILTEEDLKTFKQNETNLYAHPFINKSLFIDSSSGSLGQGLSIAVGKAIALKNDKVEKKVYVIIGDGECNEGSIWEGLMAANKYKLDNLIIIVDNNKLQYDDETDKVMPLINLKEKFDSFGMYTLECDGNSVQDLINCFININMNKSGSASAIVASTIKGKGISFMEKSPLYHHSKLTAEEREIAYKELSND